MSIGVFSSPKVEIRTLSFNCFQLLPGVMLLPAAGAKKKMYIGIFTGTEIDEHSAIESSFAKWQGMPIEIASYQKLSFMLLIYHLCHLAHP